MEEHKQLQASREDNKKSEKALLQADFSKNSVMSFSAHQAKLCGCGEFRLHPLFYSCAQNRSRPKSTPVFALFYAIFDSVRYSAFSYISNYICAVKHFGCLHTFYKTIAHCNALRYFYDAFFVCCRILPNSSNKAVLYSTPGAL